MAYNNGFPMGYQQLYYPQANVAPAGLNQPQASSGIIWVQGEAGAKSYLVAPNSTVVLWDTESQTIYLKSADVSGMPSIKVLDYKIREVGNNVPAVMSGDYVTKDELNALRKEITDKLQTLKSGGVTNE